MNGSLRTIHTLKTILLEQGCQSLANARMEVDAAADSCRRARESVMKCQDRIAALEQSLHLTASAASVGQRLAFEPRLLAELDRACKQHHLARTHLDSMELKLSDECAQFAGETAEKVALERMVYRADCHSDSMADETVVEEYFFQGCLDPGHSV